MECPYLSRNTVPTHCLSTCQGRGFDLYSAFTVCTLVVLYLRIFTIPLNLFISSLDLYSPCMISVSFFSVWGVLDWSESLSSDLLLKSVFWCLMVLGNLCHLCLFVSIYFCLYTFISTSDLLINCLFLILVL